MNIADRILFNPKVSNTLAALDDSKSMFSVAARDLIDSSGRTYMEYKRDPHGGRERLLEEFFTFAIWGFGVRAMKHLYDAAVVHLPFTRDIIKLPDLDTSLLKKGGKGAQEEGQKLTYGLVNKFYENFGKNGQYKELLDVVKEPKLQAAYRKSSIAKFAIASGAPALAIGFLIPAFNQWLTKQKIEQAKAAKNKAGSASPKPPNAAFSNKAVGQPLYGGHSFAMPMTNGFSPALANYATPFASAPGQFNYAAPAANQPMAANHPGKSKNNAVRFGGPSDIASAILQNERWNTLLIDGTISGGRIYKARNTIERFEIFFREAAIISFLYWFQRPLQDFIGKRLGNSELEFKTIQHLSKNKKYQQNPAQFHRDFKTDLDALTNTIHQKSSAAKSKAKLTGGWKEMMDTVKDKDNAMVETVYDYFLNKRNNNKQKNMILESAIDAGLIPTFHKQPGKQSLVQHIKTILHEINPIKEQELTKNKFLDLTKKIDTEPIFAMVKDLQKLSNKTVKTPKNLDAVLKKTMRLRASSWFLSNAVCFTFLSIIIPSIQHYITFKRTGKNYFPGVQ